MNQPPCVCMSTVLRACRAQPGPEGIQRSTQCKQRPPHDLRCLLAAKTRGLHILTIIIAFCSFSINLTWLTLFLYFFFFFHLSFFPPCHQRGCSVCRQLPLRSCDSGLNVSKSLKTPRFFHFFPSLLVIGSRRCSSLSLSPSYFFSSFKTPTLATRADCKGETQSHMWTSGWTRRACSPAAFQPAPPSNPLLLTVVTCAPAGPRCPKIKRPLSRARRINISLSIFQNSF